MQQRRYFRSVRSSVPRLFYHGVADLRAALTANASSIEARDGGGSGGDQQPSNFNSIATAHGALASVAFVAIFPIGAILVRLGNFSNVAWVHAASQGFAYIIFIAAAGLGIWMSTITDQWNAHPIIGLVLLSVLLFQPFFGWHHHRKFKRNMKRTWTSYIHVYLGRCAILLGMINGGLGLQMAGSEKPSYVAYGVCAGVVGVVYLASIVIGEWQCAKNPPPGEQKEKRMSESDGSDSA